MLATVVDSADDGIKVELASIDACIMGLPSIEETLVERAMRLLSLFNTQPHLLDKHLAKWIRHLGECIRQSFGDKKNNDDDADDADNKQSTSLRPCALFYTLSMVRGLKTCMSFLPCDLDILEEVLAVSQVLISNDCDWRIRYTLLAWCAILARQPFDLSVMLTDYDRYVALLQVAKRMAMSPCRPERRPAILLLACSVFSRPDERDRLFLEAMESDNLELLYRLAKQSTNPIHLQKVSSYLSKTTTTTNNDNVSREKGRWKCKLLSLLLSWSSSYDDDVPPDPFIQSQITHLLFHKDLSIREQMAKSLSKCKLATDFVLALIASLPHQCTAKEAHLPVMHGVCMLIGYGVLRRTVDVSMYCQSLVGPLITCLRFDYSKGTYSVGPVVRDAACFVVWAWSKRHTLSSSCPVPSAVLETILAMAMLDREVVLRRAAAAAFQEAGGRSLLIDGLDGEATVKIITMINYYTVSNQQACVDAFCQVYHHYPVLRSVLSSCLCGYLLPHWDRDMRQLAADIHKKCQCVSHDDIKTVLEGPIVDLFLFHAMSLLLFHCRDLVSVEPVVVFHGKDLGADLVLESLLYITARQWTGSDTQVALLEQAMSFRCTAISDLLHHTIIPKIISTMEGMEGTRRFLLASLPKSDKTTDLHTRHNWIMVMSAVPVWFQERLPSFGRLLARLFPTLDCRGRVCCLRAIESLLQRFGGDTFLPHCPVADIVTKAYCDYTVDPQDGDIGSLVRLQAIDMTPCLLHHIPGMKTTLLHLLMGQAVGRLDRLRDRAIHMLSSEFDVHVDGDIFLSVQESQEYTAMCMDTLIYTAGSPLMTAITERALSVLRHHSDMLMRYQCANKRVMSAKQRVLDRLHTCDHTSDPHVATDDHY